MKNRILSALLLLALLLPVLFAVSCGQSTGTTYRDDYALADLAAKVADKSFEDGVTLTAVDADYLRGMMKMEVGEKDEYVVKIQTSGANVNEYGIFHAPDAARTAEIETMVKAYLALRVESWMPEYMPEEKPKVDHATCKVFGNYVVYGILTDADREALFSAVENALKAN